MEHLERDEQLRAYVRRELPGFLQEERDRKLFAELLEMGSITDGAASPYRGHSGSTTRIFGRRPGGGCLASGGSASYAEPG